MSTALARAAVRSFLRDYEVDGVPVSGTNEPAKAEGRYALSLLADAIDTASADVANALLTGENIYPDTTTGLAGTAANGFFFVPVEDGLELFKDLAGVATSQGVIPNSTALSDQLAAITEAADRLPGAFRGSVTDPLLLNTIKEAYPFGAWSHEDFHVNVRWFDYGGPPYNKWPEINLFDASSGDRIAYWSKTNVNPATESEWVFLTNVADGDPQDPYQGIVAAFRIDWPGVTALGWNDNMTTHTDAVAAGLRRENNRPPEALESFLTNFTPYASTLVGAAEAETSVTDAVEAAWRDDLEVGRGSFPNSDRSNPATPLQILMVDADHDEEIAPRVVTGLETGLVLPNWSELAGPPTARLWMAGGSGALLEANQPSRVRGFKAEHFGSGYPLHIDPDGLLQRPANGPAVMRYYGVYLIEDMEFVAHGLTSSSCGIGGAIGNKMKLLIRRCIFRRGAGTAPHITLHTTPGTTDAGDIGFEDNWFEPGVVAIQFLKKHETDVRHKVWGRGNEGGAVQCGIDGGISGDSAFVRAGRLEGFSSVSALLDPA